MSRLLILGANGSLGRHVLRQALAAGHVADGERFVGLVRASRRRSARGEVNLLPHQVNFERLSRSRLDWRLLCPGPMVDEAALGLNRMRISIDALPVESPAGLCRTRPACRSSRR